MPASFVDLCHHAWSVPALAILAGDAGAKLVTVARRLEIAPQTAKRTIRALIALDLVMPNPGYGHPMRPEYILTPDGEAIGRPVVALWNAIREASEDARRACRRKWALPCLGALGRTIDRFSEIERALPGVTPRALIQTLDALVGAGLIERDIESDARVRVAYSLTPDGEPIARATLRLWDALAPNAHDG